MLRELVFGLAFLVAAIGAAADFWGNDPMNYYAGFARDTHLERTVYHFPDGDRMVPLDFVLQTDHATRTYVVCGCFRSDALAGMSLMFNADEIAHLDDVRRVFAGVQTASSLAAIVAGIAGLGLARRRIRRAVLVAAGVTVLVGAVAAVAFEPLFLAFHEVFFPQGNFLFDPSRDNLTLVYPEDYWLGVTLRLGATVVALCFIVGGLVSLPIRSSAAARSNKGTVR
ncbi:MAG: hypothetical protein AUH85_05145 [Chloroflexi bacterium 13_1_40CM_4_68_4]|nr:MAG: hypothetical protein AUH85_05145 [Chloroflexi bacterium 13_1_40CM_4_68_4]